jgi:2-dehydro-3-deoxyphosphogluconate aldolase/(4S)-4-hydroxy-2-oxoglutarate aldolase
MLSELSDVWINRLQQHRAIAVLRIDDLTLGLGMAQALAAGGMRLIEVTWNSAQPAHLLARLRETLPACTIGVGTILTLQELRTAIAAGAEFVFSPHYSPALVQAALAEGIPMIPGALTPTEIVTAWQAGASCVKVFPVASVGGVAYIRHLRPPLGSIPLIPTGGVTIANARSFIDAGAIAVGLAGDLLPPSAIAAQNWPLIQQRAHALVQALQPVQTLEQQSGRHQPK